MQIRQLELSLELPDQLQPPEALDQAAGDQQFLGLYSTEESLKIGQEELKNATESHQIIESKVKAGISAPEELYQADLTRLNSVAGLENRQMSYENALDSFRILLGMSLSETFESSPTRPQEDRRVDLDKAVDHAQKNRMEIRQRDISLQNAFDNLIRVDAENEFKGSIDVSLGLTGVNHQLQDLYQSSNTDRQIAVSLNIPVFDWGQKAHRLAASQASIDTQRLSGRAGQADDRLRQAYPEPPEPEAVEIAEVNVQNAERTYEINLERYKNGDLVQTCSSGSAVRRLNQVGALINYKLASRPQSVALGLRE
jgi:outer membrane protein TolC